MLFISYTFSIAKNTGNIVGYKDHSCEVLQITSKDIAPNYYSWGKILFERQQRTVKGRLTYKNRHGLHFWYDDNIGFWKVKI